jgi:hypothetical protein
MKPKIDPTAGRVAKPKSGASRYMDLVASTAPRAALAPEEIVFQSRNHTVREIHRTWEQTQDDFLTIGRWLNAAKDALPHGEYQSMVRTDLPFSTSLARKLRTVAEFVDKGVIPREQLPNAYSKIYEIATLPEPALQEVKGEIHPDIPLRELTALRRRYVPRTITIDHEPLPVGNLAALRERRRRLLAELLEVRQQMKDAI